MRRIKRNIATCTSCLETIESKYRLDFVTCSCGNLSVDGGHAYLKRNFRDGKDSYKELSEFYEEKKKD